MVYKLNINDRAALAIKNKTKRIEIRANKDEKIDYGKINGTDFFCTCGVGFDAFVSLKFAHAGKRGLLTYLEKTLQESLKYEPET